MHSSSDANIAYDTCMITACCALHSIQKANLVGGILLSSCRLETDASQVVNTCVVTSCSLTHMVDALLCDMLCITGGALATALSH